MSGKGHQVLKVSSDEARWTDTSESPSDTDDETGISEETPLNETDLDRILVVTDLMDHPPPDDGLVIQVKSLIVS